MAATHLDVGLRCIKYLLCAINSLFVLTGIMIISLGTTIFAVHEDFSHFLDSSYFSPATLLVVVGVLIFVIAFCGCCGALRESTCMVLVFAVSLSLVLILEFAAAIAAYALQDGIQALLSDKIEAAISVYDTNEEIKDAVDFMQSTLRCCGYNGSKDWLLVSRANASEEIPVSCNVWIGDRFMPSPIGCVEQLSIIVHRSALYIGTGALAIALIQLTGIMFACMLGKAIRRQKTLRERRRWELRENLVNGYEPLGKADPFMTFPVVYMKPQDPPIKT